LKLTYRAAFPFITVKAEYDRIKEQIRRRLSQTTDAVMFNCGELADSLALEHLTGAGREFIPWFGDADNGYLFMLTKSDNVYDILDLQHNGHTVVAWSLNEPSVSRKFEIGAPPFERRLEAARKVQAAGYPIRIRLDPIVPFEGWREAYAETIRSIFTTISPERITIGTLRFEEEFFNMRNTLLAPESGLSDLLSGMAPMFPAKVFAGTKRPKAGKYSFSEDQRFEIFSFIIDEIRKHSEIPIAVCKESSEVWTRLGLDMTECQCVCQFDRFDLKAEREGKMLEPNTDPAATDEKEIAELSEMDDDNLIFDDDPAIHAAIKFMRGKIKSKFLATSLEIGNYVLKKFFHDSPSEASDRNRAKNTSFRKLCENQYLPLSKTNLNLMVRIAVQDRIFEKKEFQRTQKA
jgi:spore photoproduct lyase